MSVKIFLKLKYLLFHPRVKLDKKQLQFLKDVRCRKTNFADYNSSGTVMYYSKRASGFEDLSMVTTTGSRGSELRIVEEGTLLRGLRSRYVVPTSRRVDYIDENNYIKGFEHTYPDKSTWGQFTDINTDGHISFTRNSKGQVVSGEKHPNIHYCYEQPTKKLTPEEVEDEIKKFSDYISNIRRSHVTSDKNG